MLDELPVCVLVFAEPAPSQPPPAPSQPPPAPSASNQPMAAVSSQSLPTVAKHKSTVRTTGTGRPERRGQPPPITSQNVEAPVRSVICILIVEHSL